MLFNQILHLIVTTLEGNVAKISRVQKSNENVNSIGHQNLNKWIQSEKCSMCYIKLCKAISEIFHQG